MKRTNLLFVTVLAVSAAIVSAEEKAAEKTPAAQTQEAGKNQLRNGSFTELDKNGKPKFWILEKSAVVKSGSGNELKINRRAYQLLAHYGDVSQKPFERKIAYSFTASGKGKLHVYFYRYSDTTDPKAKHGYRRKFNGSDRTIYTLTEKPQVFSDEYTIKANEWVGFGLHASDAVVDDVSLRLVK